MSAELERLTLDPALRQVVAEAEDIARQIGRPPHSLHLLLALFTTDNPARRALLELGIDEDRLLEVCDPRAAEPRPRVRGLLTRAARVAAGCGADQVDPLHLLVAFTQEPDTVGRAVLEATREPLVRIRARALSERVPKAPRWTQSADTSGSRVETQRIRQTSARTLVPTEAPPPSAKRRPAPPTAGRIQAPSVEPGPWELDPVVFPWLTSLGRNLSAAAARGELDPLVGREPEIGQLMDILGKRRANNPCLIGEPGVGKTAVVEGLAVQAQSAPPRSKMRRWVFVSLDVGRLLMGTHLRGSFSEKLQGLLEEVRKSDGRIIVFIDEIHSLMGAGASEGSPDATQELKAAWSRGAFPCIGATTFDEYHRSIGADPALKRRFVTVRVNEPTVPDCLTMMAQIAPQYAQHHGVAYEPQAVDAAVRLSARYLPEQRLPDKAIAILDLAGSRATRSGLDVVRADLVRDLVAERIGSPPERLWTERSEGLLRLEERLAERIVGHRPQLARISDSIRRNAAGFRGDRPQSVFLLLGPSGVGKTEIAKALAEEIFSSKDDLLRFDFNEFSEAHSVARLIGAPPGYVGHESGGQLTDAVRRNPGRVILFDEVEKAHPEVMNVLLRLLDEGRLTDAKGITVPFAETILIMTSNAGSRDGGRRLGFHSETAAQDDQALERAAAQFSPELWARIPEKLVFGPLRRSESLEIGRRLASESSERLFKERGVRFELDSQALAHLVDHGARDPRLGARPLRAALERLVESTIARRILEGRLHADETVWVSVRDGGLCFQVGDHRESLSKRPAVR